MSRGKDTLRTKQNSFTTLTFKVCVCGVCAYVYTCSHVYGIMCVVMHVYISKLREEIAAGCLSVLLSSFTTVSFFFNQVIRVHSNKHLKTSSKTF